MNSNKRQIREIALTNPIPTRSAQYRTTLHPVAPFFKKPNGKKDASDLTRSPKYLYGKGIVNLHYTMSGGKIAFYPYELYAYLGLLANSKGISDLKWVSDKFRNLTGTDIVLGPDHVTGNVNEIAPGLRVLVMTVQEFETMALREPHKPVLTDFEQFAVDALATLDERPVRQMMRHLKPDPVKVSPPPVTPPPPTPSPDIPERKVATEQKESSGDEIELEVPGLFGGKKKVNVTLPGWVHELKTETKDAIGSFKTLATDVQSALKDLARNLQNTLLQFDTTLETIKMVERVVGFITMIIAAVRASSLIDKALIVTSWVAAAGVLSNGIKAGLTAWLTHASLLDTTKVVLADGSIEEKAVEQGKSDKPNESLWTSFVGTVKYLFGIETDKTAPLAETRVKKLGSFFGMFNSLSTFLERVVRLFKWAFEGLFQAIYGYPYAMRGNQELINNMNFVIRAAVAFRFVSDKTLGDPSVQFLLHSAVIKADQVDIALKKNTDFCVSYSQAAKEIRQRMHRAKSIMESGKRRKPIWVHLDGKPAMGKSQLMKWIYFYFLKHALGLDLNSMTDATMIYSFNQSDKYAENYAHQPVFLVDDLFQLDIADTKAELADLLIHLVNTVPYPLNMADIDKKGNTFFTSPLVITTSNNSKFDDLKIASVAAFIRRIDFWVVVERDPNNNVISTSSEIDEAQWRLKLLPPNAWEAKIYDKGKPLPPAQPIELLDLLKAMVTKYQQDKHLQDASDEQAKRFASSNPMRTDQVTPSESDPEVKQLITALQSISDKNAKDVPIRQMHKRDIGEKLKLKLNQEVGPQEVAVKYDAMYKDAVETFHKYFNTFMERNGHFFRSKTSSDTGLWNFFIDPTIDVEKVPATEVADLKPLVDFAEKGMPKPLIALALVTGVLGTFASGAALWNCFNQAPIQQAYQNTEKRIKLKVSNALRKTKAKLSDTPRPQSDKGPIDIATLCANQTFPIIIVKTDGSTYNQKCMFVFDRVFVTTKHFLQFCDAPDFSHFIIEFNDQAREYTIGQFKRTYDEMKDVAYVHLHQPKGVQSFRDLTNHFINSIEDIQNALTAPVLMLRTNSSDAPVVQQFERMEFMTTLETYGDDTSDDAADVNCVFRIFSRSAPTTRGDCSLPYISKANSLQSKILGFHIAGSSNYAYCQIIFRDDLDAARDHFGLISKQMSHGPTVPSVLNPFPLPCTPVPRVPCETELVPSAIFDLVAPHTREPAALKPGRNEQGEWVSPAQLALEKTLRPNPKMSDEDFALYKECLRQAYKEQLHPLSVPICAVSIEQALNRPTGYSHVSPVWLDTSAGYHSDVFYESHGVKRTSSKKYDFIEQLPNGHRVPKPLLVDAVKELIAIGLGRKPRGAYYTYVIDLLKDELRPIARVRAKKTRLFSSMPVEFLVLMRALFLDQIECEIANHNLATSTSAFGINPESREWKDLRDRLCPGDDPKSRESIIANDIEKQDASTTTSMVTALTDIDEEFYIQYELDQDVEILPGIVLTKSERVQLRRWLNEEVYLRCAHIFFGQCYVLGKNNPSGQVKTTPSNTKHTRASALFCAVKFTQWKSKESSIRYPALPVNVVARLLPGAAFGDDHIWSVLGQLREYGFGNGPMKYFSDSIGYELTDCHKRPFQVDPVTLKAIGIPELLHITEVQFLKRSFREINSAVYAPLDWDVVEDTTNWISSKRNPIDATADVCTAALMNAYHHGKEKFNLLREKIRVALERVGLEYIMPTVIYDDLFAHFHQINTNRRLPPLILPGFEDVLEVITREPEAERPIRQMGKHQKGQNLQKGHTPYVDYSVIHPPAVGPSVSVIPLETENRAKKVVVERPRAAPATTPAEKKTSSTAIDAEEWLDKNFPPQDPDPSKNPHDHDDTAFNVLLPNGHIVGFGRLSKEQLDFYIHEIVNMAWQVFANTVIPRQEELELDTFVHAVLTKDPTDPTTVVLQQLQCPDHRPCMGYGTIFDKINWHQFFPSLPDPRLPPMPVIQPESLVKARLTSVSPIDSRVKPPPHIHDVSESPIHNLQIWCQRHSNQMPVYTFTTTGPSHAQLHSCIVVIPETSHKIVSGNFSSKKSAKCDAARLMLNLLRTLVRERPIRQMAQEQKEKSKEGLISGITASVARLGHALSVFPIIGGFSSKAAEVLDYTTPLLRALNLDYPSNTSATQPYLVRQTSSLAHTKGLDTVPVLAADPTNQVSNDIGFFCEKSPTSMFANYKLLPAVVSVGSFDGTYVQNQLIAKYPLNPMFCNESASGYYAITPLANLASNFRYWRGGMKFKLFFVTSRYVSVRVRAEWHPDPSTITPFVNDNSGDIVSLTVDICGDTDVEFTIPYLKDTPWLVTVPPGFLQGSDSSVAPVCNGYLALRVIIPAVVSNSAADTTVDYSLWISGAEDICFARPQEFWADWTYSTTLAGKEKPIRQMCSIQADFRKVFKPMVPASYIVTRNVLQGETIASWPELFHRYTSVANFATGSESLSTLEINPWLTNKLVSDGYGDPTTNWARFQNSFLLHRGNTRVKVLITDSNSSFWLVSNSISDPLAIDDADQDDFGLRRGVEFNSSDFRKIVEAEIPYYGIFPFATQINPLERFELPCSQVTIVKHSNQISSGRVCLATGDNYSCGQIAAPGFFVDEGSVSQKAIRQMNKDEGHGNTERKVIDSQVRDGQQLTSYQDQVGVKEDPIPATTPVHLNSDPYRDQGLTQVLSRPYLTHTFTWDGSATVNTLLHKLSYPVDLFLIPTIADKLNNFQFFRSPVHCAVRLNSTTFHSGKLLIVRAPHWNPNNSVNLMSQDDIFMLSSLDSILVSANSNETVEFDIPYVAPSTYLDLQLDTSIGSTGEGFFGTVKIFVLAPLRLTGATSTPSITVTVYSNFADPQVAGFTTKSIATRKKQLIAKAPVSQRLTKKAPIS